MAGFVSKVYFLKIVTNLVIVFIFFHSAMVDVSMAPTLAYLVDIRYDTGCRR